MTTDAAIEIKKDGLAPAYKRGLPLSERVMNWSIPVPITGCWLWLGNMRGPKGYGSLKVDGVVEQAHRASWMAFHGAIPKGMHVLHRCDVPSCVNPSHLFLGTNSDNVRDKKLKGRASALFGEANGRAKLTADDVRAIRASLLGATKLAKKYGVTRTIIWYVRSRSTWKHL